MPPYEIDYRANIDTGNDIPIEQGSIDEAKGFREFYWAAEDVSIRNPAFDVTPSELIKGLIPEKGVIFNPNREKLERLFF